MNIIQIAPQSIFSRMNAKVVVDALEAGLGERPEMNIMYHEKADGEEFKRPKELEFIFQNTSITKPQVIQVLNGVSIPEGQSDDEISKSNSIKSRLEQAEADIVLLKQQVQQLLGV